MEEKIDLNKLIQKISIIDISKWVRSLEFKRGSYTTSLEDQFNVSLSVNYDKYFNADDGDYMLFIYPRLKFNPITFSGKDVKILYDSIEKQYDKRKDTVLMEDRMVLINKMNEFLNKE